ncbi:MAG TPA: CPBP family intramembrane glutamic endopeptidase [Roseiflexaceae bacterium]|nr:CPBP family intramembrane glutamic endopeptidase [Roseiflexaceae bacterium]
MIFIKRHPVLTYFVLVYAITWGGILLIVQAFTAPGEAASTSLVAVVALPMLLAPGIAGITVTALVDGRIGLAAMLSRMTRWRVERRWYVVALATMPLLVLAILCALGVLVSPAFAPALSLFGLAGLAAGFFEEIGWTGFAVPRLRSRWGWLAVGLWVGALWGLWHGVADFVIRGNALGTFWPVTFGLFVLPLVAWRILMVWVYDNTSSGVVAQFMHFGYTGSLALFVPALSRTDDALVYAVLAGALWIGVAIVAMGQRRVPRALQAHVSATPKPKGVQPSGIDSYAAR